MIEFQRKMGPFKIKEIWFSDDIYDVEGVDAVQFRNANFTGDKPGFTREASTTLIIDLTQSLDDIWKAMDKNATRHNISRAQSDGTIAVLFNEKYDEYDAINRDFRKRKGLPSAMIPMEEMKKNYFLSTYEKDGVVLGGHLCIKDKRSFRLLLACNSMTPESTFSRSIYGRANKLSIWEMIKFAKEEGVEEFDFGGFATGQQAEDLKGINEFKLSFGGVVAEKNSYSKTYSKSFDMSKSIYLSAVSAGHRIGNMTRRKAEKAVEKPQETEAEPAQKSG